MKTGFKAQVVFTGSGTINSAWDPQALSRGLVADGNVLLFGIRKKAWLTLAGEAAAGSTSLSLSGPTIDSNPQPPAAYEAWIPGDEIVVAGTYFQRIYGSTATSSRDDKRTLSTVSASTVTLTSGLSYEHRRATAADSAQKIHVVNLTRNVVFRSLNASQTSSRAHIMLRRLPPNAAGTVDIRHVAFVGLGRTDKRVPLDDFTVTTTATDYSINPSVTTINNRRGRYSLHIHQRLDLAQALPAAADKVWDSVVVDAIGWGFVNHSSWVDFQRNVVYDFNGAAFVTEAGNELGNFNENIAIRGRGNGEFRPIRIVFGNTQRRQPLADFAFSGDGFWFQGPAIRATNNVASGCDGAGMIWFTTGAPDVETSVVVGSNRHNQYSYFPRHWVPPVYGSFTGLLPRYWNHGVSNERLIISDLPILEMNGFDSYGNLVGFRLRFVNQWNTDWYTEDPYNYDNDITSVCGGNIDCATRRRQSITNLRLWNDEQAFSVRYATKTDWNNVKAVNRLAYSDPKASPDLYVGHAGAEINFQMQDTTFANITIDGYPVPGWIQDNSTAVRSLTCFQPQCPTTVWTGNYANYLNYANKDTWARSLDSQCLAPTSPWHPTVTSTSATLQWTPGANNSRWLVRYRVFGKDSWTPVAATNPVTISNLTSLTTYEFQVLAGCTTGGSEALSVWSTTDTFTTN